jgi:hypothetical protein
MCFVNISHPNYIDLIIFVNTQNKTMHIFILHLIIYIYHTIKMKMYSRTVLEGHIY